MQTSFTELQLREAISTSFSIRQVAAKLNLCQQGGGTYRTIYKYITLYNIDTTHFTGCGHLKGKTHNYQTKPLDVFLSQSQNSVQIKNRLWKEKILRKECYECGLGPTWNNKPLSLQLDHINGNHNDNSIDNLRILCPNCHTQTNTFCSKNIKDKKIKPTKPTKLIPSCLTCGIKTTKPNTRCPSCAQKHRNQCQPQKTKINWPDQITLFNMVKNSSYTAVAHQLGVSDNAIRKKIKNGAPD